MRQFKVGDRVRIRSWEDMEREFGIGDFGSIACKFHFTPDMRHMCGKEATIEDIPKESKVILKFSEDSGLSTYNGRIWSFSFDMIELVDMYDETEIDDEELTLFLCDFKIM